MHLFPAIDLFEGKAVRLMRGDYNQMTVYSHNPVEIARDFQNSGAKMLHIVDLEGAKTGATPNLPTIKKIVKEVDLFVQVGGGIRSLQTVEDYLRIGVNRVILGTAAVNNPAFLQEAVAKYADAIAVGVDIRDGYVAINGWTEKSNISADAFFEKMDLLGVKTVICTDISRDGAMQGTNRELYRVLSQKFSMDIIASGGVSNLEDIQKLTEMGLYGAIVGKAYYTGAISLQEALEVARC